MEITKEEIKELLKINNFYLIYKIILICFLVAIGVTIAFRVDIYIIFSLIILMLLLIRLNVYIESNDNLIKNFILETNYSDLKNFSSRVAKKKIVDILLEDFSMNGKALNKNTIVGNFFLVVNSDIIYFENVTAIFYGKVFGTNKKIITIYETELDNRLTFTLDDEKDIFLIIEKIKKFTPDIVVETKEKENEFLAKNKQEKWIEKLFKEEGNQVMVFFMLYFVLIGFTMFVIPIMVPITIIIYQVCNIIASLPSESEQLRLKIMPEVKMSSNLNEQAFRLESQIKRHLNSDIEKKISLGTHSSVLLGKNWILSVNSFSYIKNISCVYLNKEKIKSRAGTEYCLRVSFQKINGKLSEVGDIYAFYSGSRTKEKSIIKCIERFKTIREYLPDNIPIVYDSTFSAKNISVDELYDIINSWSIF